MPIHDWTRVDAGLFHAFHQGWISALSCALNTGGLPPEYFALIEQATRHTLLDFLDLSLPAGHIEPIGKAAHGFAVAAAPPRAPGPAGRRDDLCAQGGSDRGPASTWPDRRRGRDRIAREQVRLLAELHCDSLYPMMGKDAWVAGADRREAPGPKPVRLGRRLRLRRQPPGSWQLWDGGVQRGVSNKFSNNELRTFVEKTSNMIAQGVHLLVIDLFPPSKRDPQGIHKAIWDEFVWKRTSSCRPISD